MNELHLFAGAGGGILGGMLLGHTCVCAVEWDKHARQCLLARQRDGCLPRFPIWDDVQTFDGNPWRGRVDVVCGGFPCQDISANGKGAGIDGERSGMWHHMARIVGEIRPRYVFVENSPMLTLRGLGRVLGDLAEMGYDSEWGVLGHCHAGGYHRRERIWIVAHSHKVRFAVAGNDAEKRRHNQNGQTRQAAKTTGGWPHCFNGTVPADYLNDWQIPKAGTVRGIDGMADWVDRIARIGNGQVPQVVKHAWESLTKN